MQRVPKMLHWHLLHPSLKTTVGSRYMIKCLPFLCPRELHSNFLRDIFVLQTMMIWFVSKASDILTCAPMSRPTFWFLLHKLPQLSRTWREKRIFSPLAWCIFLNSWLNFCSPVHFENLDQMWLQGGVMIYLYLFMIHLYHSSYLLVQAPPFLVHWQVLHLYFSLYFCT